jgi:hypothetical protein
MPKVFEILLAHPAGLPAKDVLSCLRLVPVSGASR